MVEKSVPFHVRPLSCPPVTVGEIWGNPVARGHSTGSRKVTLSYQSDKSLVPIDTYYNLIYDLRKDSMIHYIKDSFTPLIHTIGLIYELCLLHEIFLLVMFDVPQESVF